MIPRKRRRSLPAKPAGENGAPAPAVKTSRQPSPRQPAGETATTLQQKPEDRGADPSEFRLDKAPFKILLSKKSKNYNLHLIRCGCMDKTFIRCKI